jgi:hypothetical protein
LPVAQVYLVEQLVAAVVVAPEKLEILTATPQVEMGFLQQLKMVSLQSSTPEVDLAVAEILLQVPLQVD